MLVFGGSSTRGGDGLNRTFGRPKVRPYFRPADRLAEGTAVPSAGRVGGPKVRPDFRPADRPAESTPSRQVRRADRYAEPQVRLNPAGRPRQKDYQHNPELKPEDSTSLCYGPCHPFAYLFIHTYIHTYT